MNDFIYRINFTLPADDKERVTIQGTEKGLTDVVLDVHGLKCSQARKIINNMLNISRQKFRLVVIHGFHGGTAIKDMIPEMHNEHIIDIQKNRTNPGMTYILAA